MYPRVKSQQAQYKKGKTSRNNSYKRNTETIRSSTAMSNNGGDSQSDVYGVGGNANQTRTEQNNTGSTSINVSSDNLARTPYVTINQSRLIVTP